MIDNIIPHPSTTLAGAMSQLARSDSGSFRITDKPHLTPPGRQDNSAPLCRQWQHNGALSGSIPLQPAGSSELEEKLPKTPAISTGRCNTGLEFTRRSFKAQGFSRALI
jgi:hypothetical protein